MGGGNKGYFKDSTAREQISDVNSEIDAKNISNSVTVTVPSDWTVQEKVIYTKSNIVFLRIRITGPGLNTTRLSLKVSKCKPLYKIFTCTVGQSIVNSFPDGWCSIYMDTQGNIYLDNRSGVTLKEINFNLVYLSNDI